LRTQLLKRRREMLTLSSSGMHLSDFVKELALKYDVSTRAIYYDYKHRSNWIEGLLDIGDPSVFFYELIETHRDIRKKTVKEYLTGDNSSARIGALKLLRQINIDFQELYRHLILSQNIKRLEGNR